MSEHPQHASLVCVDQSAAAPGAIAVVEPPYGHLVVELSTPLLKGREELSDRC